MARSTAKTESTETEAAEGLASTGNANDLATPQPGLQKVGEGDSAPAHQDSAPEELTKLADKATEQGYLGADRDRPDYSQANPAVMNGKA